MFRRKLPTTLYICTDCRHRAAAPRLHLRCLLLVATDVSVELRFVAISRSFRKCFSNSDAFFVQPGGLQGPALGSLR